MREIIWITTTILPVKYIPKYLKRGGHVGQGTVLFPVTKSSDSNCFLDLYVFCQFESLGEMDV